MHSCAIDTDREFHYASHDMVFILWIAVYHRWMIRSFRDKDAERLFNDQRSRRLQAIERVARRKLEILDAAEALGELQRIRGNRLEALKGGRAGQYSIRINDQWRICFVWRDDDAEDVEIVDYH